MKAKFVFTALLLSWIYFNTSAQSTQYPKEIEEKIKQVEKQPVAKYLHQ